MTQPRVELQTELRRALLSEFGARAIYADLARTLREAGCTQVEVCADPMAAESRAREVTPANGSVLVTGSLYLIGALLPERDAPR